MRRHQTHRRPKGEGGGGKHRAELKVARAKINNGGQPPESPSFEHTIQRLGEIVELLEGGELPLEQSLRLFEEGVKLARASQRVLDGAERRVEELLGFNERGEPLVKVVEDDAFSDEDG